MAPITKAISWFLCGSALCAFAADGQRPISSIHGNFRKRLQQSNGNNEAAEQDADNGHPSPFRSSNVKVSRRSNIAEVLDNPQLKEEIYRIRKDLGIEMDDINEESDIGAVEAIEISKHRSDIKAPKHFLGTLDSSNISDFIGGFDESQLNALENLVNEILKRSGSKVTLDLSAARTVEGVSSSIKPLSEGITLDGSIIESIASSLRDSNSEEFADLADDTLIEGTAVDSANNIVTNLRGKLENVRDTLNGHLVNLSISESLAEAANSLEDGGLIEINMGGSNDLEGLRQNLNEVRDNLENGLQEVTDAANAVQKGVRENIDQDFLREVTDSANALRGKLRVTNAAKTIADKISSSIASGFIDEVSV